MLNLKKLNLRLVKKCTQLSSVRYCYEVEPPIELPQSANTPFRRFLCVYDKILVLTGAGVSTPSGIPDYRSENGIFNRSSYRPMTYTDFVKNPQKRRRYWTRNFVGWPTFSSHMPNEIHSYLTHLQFGFNKITGIVTQNVDGLHSKAGSENIVELHGNAFWVKCLNCKKVISRFDFQEILQKCNPHLQATAVDIRPDGDVELNEEHYENFQVPDCEDCGGLLKPTVVFFGENVPEGRVKKVEKLVEECDGLLVLGTTLSTLSSFRIVQQAFDSSRFICIVNQGETRADKLADLKVDDDIRNVIREDLLN